MTKEKTRTRAPLRLKIEVFDALCIVENVLLPRLDLVAHKVGEDLLGLNSILDRNLLEAAMANFHRRFGELLGVHFAKSLVLLNGEIFTVFADDRLELGLGEGPPLSLAFADAVKRRLRDEDVTLDDQRLHLPVEKRQQQRADVRSVPVCIGHDDDLVVTQL